MTEVLKAISLWQPWASLWLSPNKRHETRHWETKHHGPILVHAAKKIVFDLDDELHKIVCNEFSARWTMDLPRGAIIGLVDLTGVFPTASLNCADVEKEDFECGDFTAGRFAWRRGGYTQFRQPIPFKGHQGLFNVPRALVEEAIASGRTFV